MQSRRHARVRRADPAHAHIHTHTQTQATTSIHNLLVGKLFVDHKGSWTVTNVGGDLSVRERARVCGACTRHCAYLRALRAHLEGETAAASALVRRL